MSVQKVIGIQACREALKVRSDQEIKKILLKPDWLKNSALKDLARQAQNKSLKPEIISLKKLNRIGESHQGVCVELSRKLHFNMRSLGQNSLILILDQVQDPKNFGAIIRTAWLMAVDCIFISSKKSVGLTPAVAKTACGGVEHIPIEIKDNLQSCLRELKSRQFWIYGLDSQSEESVWREKLEGRVAFLLGGESSGLKKGLKKACDKLLSIPQTQKSASYNVSVATALVLGEYFRQNGFERR